jgi:hypothetical protein
MLSNGELTIKCSSTWGGGKIVGSDVEDDEDSSRSQTEDEVLYEYYVMGKRKKHFIIVGDHNL